MARKKVPSYIRPKADDEVIYDGSDAEGFRVHRPDSYEERFMDDRSDEGPRDLTEIIHD